MRTDVSRQIVEIEVVGNMNVLLAVKPRADPDVEIGNQHVVRLHVGLQGKDLELVERAVRQIGEDRAVHGPHLDVHDEIDHGVRLFGSPQHVVTEPGLEVIAFFETATDGAAVTEVHVSAGDHLPTRGPSASHASVHEEVGTVGSELELRIGAFRLCRPGGGHADERRRREESNCLSNSAPRHATRPPVHVPFAQSN
jgi:hypothetical protein